MQHERIKVLEKTMREEELALYEELGVSRSVSEYSESILADLTERFETIDRTAEINQLRVIHAMQKAHIGEASLKGTTGYGYDDIGRDGLEKAYAEYFHTEDALVRTQITCGTHALSLALSSNLRPGQTIAYVSGGPYDTLEGVIGIRPERGSLAEYGISYRQVDLLPDSSFDFAGIRELLKDPAVHMCAIQRSKGYSSRRTLSVAQIGEAIDLIHSLRPDVVCMVDNCYGEFVERTEPSDVGADMVVGSLIKNPGGGLAPMGGYICGTAECIENAAVRLTAPGLGKEVGATLDVLPSLFQGLFLAPYVTSSALKGAIFAAACYSKLGFAVNPGAEEERHDIIQAITFGTSEGLTGFCEGIQAASPVDSFVVPYPADMPGYDVPVIMAAGAFVSGSSIELSADGPLRAPYTAYFQGGLTFGHVRYGIMRSLQNLLDRGLITL